VKDNKDRLNQEPSDVQLLIQPYLKAAAGRKSEHVVVLDVHRLTSLADVFIVCSGRSNRQVSAIGEYVVATLKKNGIKPLSVEGLKEGQWVLLDYGDVIIHIFYEALREFYDLEGLWADAQRLDTGLEGPIVK
jgi:ribosome-associated protein